MQVFLKFSKYTFQNQIIFHQNIGIDKNSNERKRKYDTQDSSAAEKRPSIEWTKIADFPSLYEEKGNRVRINVQLKITTKAKIFGSQYKWTVGDLEGNAKTTMMIWTSLPISEDFLTFFKVHTVGARIPNI